CSKGYIFDPSIRYEHHEGWLQKVKSNTESTEEIIERIAKEVWKDEPMLRVLANIVKDSLVSELKSSIGGIFSLKEQGENTDDIAVNFAAQIGVKIDIEDIDEVMM
ncbi:hypothetical protein ANN_27826, partial [Periplaneta americana]